MKKLEYFSFLFDFVFLLLFSSCGLDEYYVLDAPKTAYNEPSVSSSTYTGQTLYDSAYFDFLTSDDTNSSDGDFTYEGTAVYYKIYNNYSTMNSHISTVSSLSNSTNASSSATKIIQDYKYVQLGTSSGSVSPLIPSSASNQRVYIRLTNYNSAPEYAARIEISSRDSSGNYSVTTTYVPRRTGNSKTFDFGRKYNSNYQLDSSGNYIKPVEGEDDVYFSSSTSAENIWYVNLYAVSVGRDNTFTPYYSDVLHLGAVAIDATLEDN